MNCEDCVCGVHMNGVRCDGCRGYSHWQRRVPDPLAGIRGLTLIQPMGWAIFHGLHGVPLASGLKDIENRTWPPPLERLGKPLAIHGGKTYNREYEEFICDLLDLEQLPPEAHATGILGVVTLDCGIGGRRTGFAAGGDPWTLRSSGRANLTLPEHSSPWYVGPYGWVLRDPILFKQPVHCRGNRSVWELEVVTRELVRISMRDPVAAPVLRP